MFDAWKAIQTQRVSDHLIFLNLSRKSEPKKYQFMEINMYRFMCLLLMPSIGWSMYAAQTLVEQIESVDVVAHVQIIAGQAHQYAYEVNGRDGPNNKKTHFETCAYSYTARVIETFKSGIPSKKEIQLTAIESFQMGSHQLVFLSDKNWALATDVISRSTSDVINQKADRCKQGLPKLNSHHLSTSEIVDNNTWINVNSFYQLPTGLHVSEHLAIRPEGDKKLKWDNGPDIYRNYGYYSRWHEFRHYLLQVIEAETPREAK